MRPDAGDGEGAEARRDAERDAWLREALRHAPDAAAAPPAALREAILSQARAATAARPAARAPTASGSGIASAFAALGPGWRARRSRAASPA
jgi:hypothetical protein